MSAPPSTRMDGNGTWIVLEGQIPTKKNQWTIRKGGRGLCKGRDLKDKLDRISQQIPWWARDLKMRHPDITIRFHVPTGRQDRDGMATTILDLLVEYGVLENDSVAAFNGTLTVPPAEYSDDPYTEIQLYCSGAELWEEPRKARGRRKAR